MEKKLKDYLHLYLGCKVLDNYSGEVYTLSGITMDGPFINKGETDLEFNRDYEEIKPILRPLSDMTGIERDFILDGASEGYWPEVGDESFSPDEVRQLLAKGFDLFGLIEAGLALDSSTLQPA